MIACALLENQAQILQKMLDLVAIGLVSDLAVGVKDTRYLIQQGLLALRHTQRPGLRALIAQAQLDTAYVDEQDIGFQLGPRLNAAGRLADSTQAVRLLLTTSAEEADSLAGQLESLNRDRRAHMEAQLARVEEQLRRTPQILDQAAIILDGDDWQLGVLGLVAGNLAQRYARPVILIAHQSDAPSVGSARSIQGIDIHKAIANQRALLLREGGHPMAAGFSLPRDNVPAFRDSLSRWLDANLSSPQLAVLEIDGTVTWEEIDLELALQIARLAPFGAGNPQPVFVVSGGATVRTEDISPRRETAHRRVYVNYGDQGTLSFTWFNAKDLPEVGESIDVAFQMAARHWKGKLRLQLDLVDWRPAVPTHRSEDVRTVAGREVVDWRQRQDAQQLLEDLRGTYGDTLVIWAEASEQKPDASVTRADLPSHLNTALAVWTPPPSPEAFDWVLSRVRPQVLYLFPPHSVPDPTAAQVTEVVAGMVRVALRAQEGTLDTVRMAAHIGTREEIILTALRGVEAAGTITLRLEGNVLRACSGQGRLRQAKEPEGASDSSPDCPIETPDLASLRQALIYLLRETRAYRQGYLTLPPEALLPKESGS